MKTETLMLSPAMRVTLPNDPNGVLCNRCGLYVPAETVAEHSKVASCIPLELSFLWYIDSLPKEPCPCGCGELMDPISAEDVRQIGHYWRKRKKRNK